MVGKLVKNIEELRAYIIVRTKLGHSVINCHYVSYETFRKWRDKCHTGTEVFKVAAK